MLESLRIRNLAIAEDVHVEFGPGLNVITGETGAGKSLLVTALGLLLGGRADRNMIRAGEDRCTVEAAFRPGDPQPIDAALDELGLEPCPDGQLVVRRIIAANGAGRNFINDSPASLVALKQLGDRLVDMHGPHDHQSLLGEGFQREVLDAFGRTDAPRAAYAGRYEALRALEARRAELEGAGQNTAGQIDLLGFQVREIDEAQLTEADGEGLEVELTRVANASRILELAGEVRAGLTESDESAFNRLVAVQRSLEELAGLLGPEAAEWREQAAALTVQLQELSRGVETAVHGVEGDPARLQWLETRKALVHRLQKKYGATVPDILAFCAKARARLDDLQSLGERLAELDADIRRGREQMEAAGRELTAARTKAGTKLARAITEELRDLGFPHGSFGVALAPAAPQPHGMDAVDYGFAPNMGEPMRPLRTIASSGEISRVMLATKAVLADHDRIPVLVFDEIDANVGGEMGHAIGRKLKRAAQGHQVLCITHLPQVAVHGDGHYVVSKEVRGRRTHTRIEQHKAKARTVEIARMLGGSESSAASMRHAEEMLAQAGVGVSCLG